MRFSWLSTALALAATVNASVLPNSLKPHQLAARDTEWPATWNGDPQDRGDGTTVTTVTSVQVVEYFAAVVEQFTTCSGQIQTVLEVEVVVQVLIETHTKISTPLQSLSGCDCAPAAKEAQFTEQYTQVYVAFEAMVEVVLTTYKDQTESFTAAWESYSMYFSSLTTVVDAYGVKTTEVIAGSINYNIYESIGIKP